MRTGANSFAGPVILLLIVGMSACIGVMLIFAGVGDVFFVEAVIREVTP